MVLAAAIAPPLSAEEPQRPNFLFIIADDQTPLELRAYDPKSVLQTPTLDRLAAEGVTIDAAHHMGSFMGAVCTPSRHMIMCGRSLWRLPIGPGPQRNCPEDIVQQTLPAVFNRAGYATMRTCKVGNSYDAANRQFAVRREATKREGNDAEGSAWHADQALDFLNQRVAEGDRRPFLLYLGFSHPHDPRDAKPELLQAYGAVNHTDRAAPPRLNARQPPLPVSYLPAHPFPLGHPDLRDEVAVSGVWRRRDEATVRNELGRECALAQDIDAQVGRVLDRLQSLGALNNTYVFYTADHGMSLGRHGLMGKQNLYEHTWRVPLIVRGPGIAPGSRAPGNVYLMDVLATLCDLAQIPPPRSNEGLSYKSVLWGRQAAVRKSMYGVYCGGTKPGLRCVKDGDWKLIKYDTLEGQVRQTQLFHLAENPHELLVEHSDPTVTALTGNVPQLSQRNLADDPRHAEKRAELESMLEAEMRRWDDPYRLWDQP